MTVVMPADQWEEASQHHAGLRALSWVCGQKQYEPPWFQDRDKVQHLLQPLPTREAEIGTAAGPCRLCVCLASSAQDEAVGTHTLGTFDRAWDRGGLQDSFVGVAEDDQRGRPTAIAMPSQPLQRLPSHGRLPSQRLQSHCQRSRLSRTPTSRAPTSSDCHRADCLAPS